MRSRSPRSEDILLASPGLARSVPGLVSPGRRDALPVRLSAAFRGSADPSPSPGLCRRRPASCRRGRGELHRAHFGLMIVLSLDGSRRAGSFRRRTRLPASPLALQPPAFTLPDTVPLLATVRDGACMSPLDSALHEDRTPPRSWIPLNVVLPRRAYVLGRRTRTTQVAHLASPRVRSCSSRESFATRPTHFALTAALTIAAHLVPTFT